MLTVARLETVYLGGIRGCSEIFLCCFRDQDRVRVCSGPVRLREQGFIDDHQVGQGEQGVQLCGVLLETAIAQLLVTEQVLDDVEGMLDDGAHL